MPSAEALLRFYLDEDIVAYLLKARTVEPLLANGSETTFVSRQRSELGSFKGVIRRTTEARKAEDLVWRRGRIPPP
jgi:hypothetical protein